MNPPAFFLSCDWGTTHFRLRLVTLPGREVVETVKEETGARALLLALGDGATPASRADAYAAFLRDRAATLAARQGLDPRTVPVVVSGMASSTVGWIELPYARAPFPIDGRNARIEAVPLWPDPSPTDAGCWLVSGLCTETDMMRGEETELIGLYASGADAALGRDCTVLLPGTHSKHLEIRSGAVTAIRTFLTGELFEILARHSLLKASVQWPVPESLEHPDARAAFDAGLACVASEGLSESLFRVRSRTVLAGVMPAMNGWFLSGLLIGAEIEGMTVGPDAPSHPVLLSGAAALLEPYAHALRQAGQGTRVRVIPAEIASHATLHAHALILQRCLAKRGGVTAT